MINYQAMSARNKIPFVVFGDDFTYLNADSNYMAMDLMILMVKMNNGKEGYWPNVDADYCSL
jgi:NAD kinase